MIMAVAKKSTRRVAVRKSTARKVVRKKPKAVAKKAPVKKKPAKKVPVKKKPVKKAGPKSSYEIIGPRPSRRCSNRLVKIRGTGVGKHRNRTQAKRLAQRAWNSQMRAGLIAANRIDCPGRCSDGNCTKIGRLTLTGFGGGPGRAWTITPTKPRGWQAVFRKWRNYRLRCRCR